MRSGMLDVASAESDQCEPERRSREERGKRSSRRMYEGVYLVKGRDCGWCYGRSRQQRQRSELFEWCTDNRHLLKKLM